MRYCLENGFKQIHKTKRWLEFQPNILKQVPHSQHEDDMLMIRFLQISWMMQPAWFQCYNFTQIQTIHNIY